VGNVYCIGGIRPSTGWLDHFSKAFAAFYAAYAGSATGSIGIFRRSFGRCFSGQLRLCGLITYAMGIATASASMGQGAVIGADRRLLIVFAVDFTFMKSNIAD
jgi:hypothetical protein